MHRMGVGLALALTVCLTAGAAHAEAALQILDSPVRAGKPARLRLVLPGELQAPLRAAAGVGSVGPFVQTAPGTFEALYQVPPGTGPALSEVVVYEDRVGGALAYALANVEDELTVQARSRPRVPTYVRAGPDRRGPFHPDARGRVELRFRASGELTHAELETAQGKSLGQVELKPTLARTVAIARPSQLAPGVGVDAEVLLVVPYDRAFKFEAPRARASGGTVALDLKGSPDDAVRYTVQTAGAALPLTVSLVDSFGGHVGTAVISASTPPAAHLAMQLPDGALEAGQRGELSFQITDAQGQPVDGTLALSVSAGTLQPAEERGPGSYVMGYVAPDPGPTAARIRARVVGTSAHAEGEIALRGSKPARVVFKPLGPLRAGGTLRVALQVLDAAGHPARPEGLSVSADQGEIAGLRDQGGGRFVVDVQAPEHADQVVLTARDGATALAGAQTLELEQPGALPFALIGPEGGFNNNFGKLSSPDFDVTGLFLVGPRSSTVGTTVGFLAGLLPETQQTLTSDQSTSGALQLTRVALLARAGAFGGLGGLGLFGGVQGGAMRLSGSLVSVGRAPLPLDTWRPAVGLYGGGGYRLGPGYLSVELRATYASVDLQTTEVRVKGPVGGVDGAVGYLFTL